MQRTLPAFAGSPVVLIGTRGFAPASGGFAVVRCAARMRVRSGGSQVSGRRTSRAYDVITRPSGSRARVLSAGGYRAA